MHPGVRRALCATSILTAAVFAGANATPVRLVDRFSAAAPVRALRARLSIDAAYRPCAAPPGRGATGAMLCSGGRARIALSPRTASSSAPTADELHALALSDLLSVSAPGKILDHAIGVLQSAARLSDRPAPILADLAAALLLRAELAGSARDVAEAIEVSEEAAELEPYNLAVLYNRALAMEAWGLVDQAAAAWRRYREADPGTAWAEEARLHATMLAAETPAPPTKPGDFSPGAVREFVANWPQQARQLGWDSLLGEWGAAVLAGDRAAADTNIGRVEVVGAALQSRGGDETLAEAARAIRRMSGDRSGLARLAEAHLEYARGKECFRAMDLQGLLRHMTTAHALASGSPALAGWSTVELAAARIPTGDSAGAARLLEKAAASGDRGKEPALEARAYALQATLKVRQGLAEDALTAAGTAGTLYRRAHETENAATADNAVADAEFSLGAWSRAYASARRALEALRPFRNSPVLPNALSAASRIATSDGMLRAAVAFQAERIAIARRGRKQSQIAEAYLGRAQAFSAVGRHAEADRDVAEAERLLAGVADNAMSRWLHVDLWLARGRRYSASEPRRAAAELDSALNDPAIGGVEFRVLQALVGRAQARLAFGDVRGAEADLDSTARIVSREGDAAFNGGNRASLLDAAQGVFDRLVMMRLAAGDTRGALEHLEHGRASFAPGQRRRTSAAGVPTVARGTVALDYALIGDTLLAWTVAGQEVRLSRRIVNRAELSRVAERARAALENGASEADLEPTLAWLYERLLRPVADRLGPAQTRLVVVADGDVPGDLIPAVYDAQRRRYFVEDHPLRFVPALRDADATSPAARRVPRALVVGDPAFNPSEFRGLPRLPQARIEADSVAALYPGARVLTDTAATRAAFSATVVGADIVHFAGHATFDDAAAERSYLVLAGAPGSRRSSVITAAQLDTLDLGGVRLVVLSACETLRSRSGRSGGFSGFAAVLLGAGAGGVVGGSWKVEDRASRRAMIEFHRAYRATGDGAGALQKAQLAMLRSPDPAFRSPAAWAAFRYAGH
jgi:CHAT domain-containing protein